MVATQSLTQSVGRQYAFTRDFIQRRIWDQVFDHSPLLAMTFGRLQNASFGGVPMNGAMKETQTGGVTVMTRANLGKNTTAKTLTGPWDTVTTDPQDTVRFTQANWKHYSATVTVSEFDGLINTGPEAISSLLEHEVDNAMRSLADLVGDHLYQNGGGDRVTDLQTIVSANNSVNQLSGATYSDWNSRGVSARGTAAASVSFASGSFAAQGIGDMRTAWLNASEGAIQPRVVLTTYDNFARYEGSLQPQERFTSPQIADGGFQQLAFKSAPVMPDAKCPSGEMYFLHPDYFKVVVLSGADFRGTEFQMAEQQEAMVSKFLLKTQTIVKDRRFLNKLTGITD